MATIELHGREITYRVRRSEKARRIALRVSPAEGLEVVLPRHAGEWYVEGMVRRHADWIVKKLDAMSRYRSGPLQTPLLSGSTVPFAGEQLVLEIIVTGRGPARVSLRGHELRMHVPSDDQAVVSRALEDWYTRVARVAIPGRVAELNSEGRFRYGRVSIRNQRTRWGSCSRKGTLSFNWRLLLRPAGVMDYLIYHEFAHLEQMNHSPKFWMVVEEICPSYREFEAWLKRHGRVLF